MWIFLGSLVEQFFGTVMTHELATELTLDATADKLFRCYTDPKLLKKWFAPEPWTLIGGSAVAVARRTRWLTEQHRYGKNAR
jgi:uncharacterized protein YndB with AHSA1/START domain